jgi:hypothetical protein
MYLSQYLPLTAGAVHTGVNYIYSLTLAGGVDASTLTIYDGPDATSGHLVWKLSAVAAGSATITFAVPLEIRYGIFVVLSGTTPLAFATVDYVTNAARLVSSSVSPSLSPSASESPSLSPSLSPSASESPSLSPSLSPSSSNSPSVSSSTSPSNSSSLSPSASKSPSSSVSASVSPSI